MDRRAFLASASAFPAAGFVAARTTTAAQAAEPTEDFTAGSAPGPVYGGTPVVSGPAPDAITILQPLARHATGWLEYAIDDGPFQRVESAAAGLRPFERYVLKFRLPPLPGGCTVRYRVTARSIGWVRVREFLHGEIKAGEPQTGPEHKFRTLDPAAGETSYVIWNDTHENAETLRALHKQTAALKPDFLLWNGDQTNDLHFEKDMAGQFLSPAGLSLADWPLAYVRGNHDVRGPEAHRVTDFTGTPDDRFYYAFRSGPLAAVVLDTGEDKPDDSSHFGGLAVFQSMQRRQAEWLAGIVKQPWFRDAPFKILFCHIPLWFTRDIFPMHKRWEFTPVCRELWLPSLAAAGVNVVVSGHTHDHRWMPASEKQPIAQLIGGGPQPGHATIIHGHATGDGLTLKMSKLDGTVLAEAKFGRGAAG